MANGDSSASTLLPKGQDRQDDVHQDAAVAIPVSSRRKLPDFLQSVNLQHVKQGYHYLITHGPTLLLIPLFLSVLVEISRMKPEDLLQLWTHLEMNLVSVITCASAVVFGATVFWMSKPSPVYLVDFACYLPPDNVKAPTSMFVGNSVASGFFDEKSLEFQKKILARSGLGEDTYLPYGVRALPPCPTVENARIEAEDVMFGALDELFTKTKVKPSDISILVVNCSLFCPTPSLSAMIINKYKLKPGIRSFNLGGMGCSAGVISIDLAKDMLQVHSGSYAIVVSTENITQNWYFGNQRSMLIPNCIFRMGGAAILLSNKYSDAGRSKYRLVQTVRTHMGYDEKCFRCVYQEEDSNGKLGVSLSKDLLATAGDALKTNITTLGPLVLPLSEQILFFMVLVARKVFGYKLKPYIPDFKLAFEHFCIHAGGRAVLDEIEKNLQLTEWHMEPSRMTLYRFGNTSSSSIWYELAYSEAKGRVKRGDRVWQIAFGSGFKCNSAVWKALETIDPKKNVGPYRGFIDKLPVKLDYPE